ncbi:7-carboxy-7-deazaguanine synthase QueE [Pullulanibacillus sp. KACC 23026]|uniref:7-carboxy-7-deazaguanine synthase QueE n=1 Tax=Pullulanibacillus sp. KACC 23026 TaxID=3028315 RepID=UPI0023B17CFB|nr:7-carboxy-7-deazaguanine synthase QueE [Pullulanibacillus sp. KACC 23026]WEG15016.1 7-carboxy-7-deazaguanine synthase QueE [Pullulanibacillus sp. KACC 23026]
MNESKKKTTIPVLEIFGPTIQGEGMVVGRKTMFVRTAGCDYRCSWCDSPFTWDGSAKADIVQMTPESIWEELVSLGGERFDHVTISGGNPALLASLDALIDLLQEKGIAVALETQGSKWQPWMHKINDLTISPKPPSSGMKTNFNVLDDILGSLRQSPKATQQVSLKIVIFDEADFEYAVKVRERYPDVAFFLQVGNDDIETGDKEGLIHHLLGKYEWLIEKAIQSTELKDVRVLPQVHTLIWGNKRGV